jgi:hypothetical protein
MILGDAVALSEELQNLVRPINPVLDIPRPFCRTDVFFDPPTMPAPGVDADALRRLVSARLDALEAKHDPIEAGLAAHASRQRPLVP